MKDVKKFIDNYKLEKSENQSYNFKNTKATVSVAAQDAADRTASPELIKYLKASINADLQKISLAKGVLTISKKEQGLYAGFFSDASGQVVEEFDNVTLPVLAKTLEVKELYEPPVQVEGPTDDAEEMTEVAAQVTNVMLDHHNKTMHSDENKSGGYMKLKYGNFELEIKKSMQEFINVYRNDNKAKLKNDVKKAISAWRRNSNVAKSFTSDLEAVRALLGNWDQHGEDFSQIVFAMNKVKNG